MVKKPKLPKTIAQSLRYAKKEISPLVRARVHEKRAEGHRKRSNSGDKDLIDPSLTHLEFLERMKALRSAQQTIKAQTEKEFRGLRGQEEVGPHEVLGHLVASLPLPRLERIMADVRIGKLNALLLRPGRKIQRVIDNNERLQDLKITFRTFTAARRDLKIHLGNQSYKSAQALALYFTVLEAAADPKVRKKENLVQDNEVLKMANDILRDVCTHIISNMQEGHDAFFEVGKRRDDALMSKGGKKA